MASVLQVVVIWREGVALHDITRMQALFQPTVALGRSAVVKRIGNRIASGTFLQTVVANFRGGVQPLLDVAVSPDLPSHVFEKRQVDVNRPAGTAIKRPGFGRGVAAF